MRKKNIIIILAAAIILLGGLLFFLLKGSNVTKADIIDSLPEENYIYNLLYVNEKITFENYTFKDSSTFKKELRSIAFKKITDNNIENIKETFSVIESSVNDDVFTGYLNEYIDYINYVNNDDYYYLNGSVESSFTLYYYNTAGDSLYVISTK